MPTKKSGSRDDLFQLIHSLTKSEKRYFKVFAGTGKDTIYMKLFDLIAAQKVYDEVALKDRLREYNTVNNFHVIKKYLFELIMDCLMLYNRDYSVTFKLRRILQQVEIANSKGLYALSYRLLRGAEKTASEYERNILLQEIYALQKINLLDVLHKGYSEKDILEMTQKESTALENAKNEAFYRNIIVDIFSEYVRWEAIRKPDKNKVFKKIETHHMFTDERNATSYEARMLLYAIKGYCYHEKGDFRKSLAYRKKNLRLLEGNQQLMRLFNRNYLIAYYNFIRDLSMLKRYNEMKFHIEKFSQIKTYDIKTESEHFRRYYLIKSEYMADTGSFNEVDNFEYEFNTLLPKYSNSISNTIIRMINYHIARCYFIAGKFGESISRFVKIINQPKSEQETSIYGYSNLWIILSHFELGNYNILPYLSKSAERYFKKHKILFPVEKQLFRFFSNTKNLDDIKIMKAEMKQMKMFIKNHINPVEDKQLIYTFISDWLESKLSDRSMAEVIHKRIGRK